QRANGGAQPTATSDGVEAHAAVDKTASPSNAPAPSDSASDDGSSKGHAAGVHSGTAPTSASATNKPGHGSTKSPRPGVSGAPSSSAPALPDDIEHNPYR